MRYLLPFARSPVDGFMMLQHDPPMLSKYKGSGRLWRAYFYLAPDLYGANIAFEQEDIVTPSGKLWPRPPKPVVFFCEECGSLWAKIVLIEEKTCKEPEDLWEFVLRECIRCGDGSLDMRSWFHSYAKQLSLSMPCEILIRELNIEINKAEEVLKCQKNSI